MIEPDKVFVDSNVLLYLIDSSSKEKKRKVESLLSPDLLISTQVVAENVNVCLKKLKMDRDTAFDFGRELLRRFQTVTITHDILFKSFDIAKRYPISFWDAIILSTALQYKCSIVYSEDMQSGMVIESTLTIINPFK